VPVYLASLAGPEIFTTEGNRPRLPLFLHSLSFVIGLALVFTLTGAGAGLLGFLLSAYLGVVRQIAGILLIVFGVFLLAALKIPWLNYEKRLTLPQSIASGYFRSFLTGAVFCLAWTPCVAPLLGSILALASASGTAAQGAYLLTLYSLGLGIPFLIIGATFDLTRPLLKHIYHYSAAIYIFSGTLLIIIGILTLSNKLIWLQP
jgi:cytochrome c-type biogenesis protein